MIGRRSQGEESVQWIKKKVVGEGMCPLVRLQRLCGRDETESGGVLLELRHEVLRHRQLLLLPQHLRPQRRQHPLDAASHVHHFCT